MQLNIKAYWQNLFQKRYLNSLLKKRMGAGCLFFDRQGKILLLKPTYKDHWLLPGGVVEANESPRSACIREVKEEIGIDCQLNRLLCIDYVSNRSNTRESLQFVFYGGIVSNEESITLPKTEITDYQFVKSSIALSMIGLNSQRRLKSCLPYLQEKITLYLENGKLI